MIAPSDEFAGGVETTLEEMETGRAIVIVVKIVLAGPEEFNGDADLLGDGAGFEHVVVGEATAESAAGALHVHDNVVVGNIENFGDEQTAIFRRLAGRPELQLTIVVVRETVFGFHGGVRQKGLGVSGFSGFRGGLEGFGSVADTAERAGGCVLREVLGAAGEAHPASWPR